ncbi:MAG TPA: hypothetical protein VL485_15025 [Ktedonobacteraceae bacterium]|jgi:hypothetical protein|nr:hypothetical protein [Ktedonobacteraceae bacterium]
MANFLQPSMGEQFEADDQYVQQTELMKSHAIESREGLLSRDQMRLEQLMISGFNWKEAINLLNMREHLYENIEMQQCIEINPRMQFARWLHEHHEISELSF